MPQFLLLVAGGLAAWAGYKLFKSEQSRIVENLKKARESTGDARKSASVEPVTLEQDPKSGVYKPKDRN